MFQSNVAVISWTSVVRSLMLFIGHWRLQGCQLHRHGAMYSTRAQPSQSGEYCNNNIYIPNMIMVKKYNNIICLWKHTCVVLWIVWPKIANAELFDYCPEKICNFKRHVMCICANKCLRVGNSWVDLTIRWLEMWYLTWQLWQLSCQIFGKSSSKLSGLFFWSAFCLSVSLVFIERAVLLFYLYKSSHLDCWCCQILLQCKIIA